MSGCVARLLTSLPFNLQLTWAIMSALLTIHLTASNSLVTRKDSGVLGPYFAHADELKDPEVIPPSHKRKVMYYVGAHDQSTALHYH